MKILVTGTNGQLARSLAERGASQSDIEVVAVGRPRLDLAVRGSAADAIEAVRPNVVINAAAFTAVDLAEDQPDLAMAINAEGAAEVAAAAARIGAAVVQISTDYIFDGRAKGPYVEDAEPRPLSVYGVSKFAGEERVRAANSRHVIVRTAWLYSGFGKNFVKTVVAAAAKRDVLTVVEDQIGSPTAAPDLADGLLQMARSWRESPQRGMGEIYHLAGSGETSWYNLAAFVMEQCRKHRLASAEVHPIRTADWPTRAVRPANSILDSGKFARDFDFVMPDWRASTSLVVDRLAAEHPADR